MDTSKAGMVYAHCSAGLRARTQLPLFLIVLRKAKMFRHSGKAYNREKEQGE